MSDIEKKSTKMTTDASKKKRRPRSAAGERNFVCGCSKAYLSYPALYTHVKNKHDGIFPEGSNLKKKSKKLDPSNMDPFANEKKSYINEIRTFFRRIEYASVDAPVIVEDDLKNPFSNKKHFGDLEEEYAKEMKDAIKAVLKEDGRSLDEIFESLPVNQD